ncbi:MAG: PDZ domain-containing protein [Proteobacteria bacterium]|nr:PDZ domain-containing protein [Pseudomonadota bacterium]
MNLRFAIGSEPRLAGWLALGLLASGVTGAAENSAGTAQVEVDARQAPRGIMKVHLTLPAKAGPLTLVYPKWLPGRHGPAGPITDLAGPTFTHDGQPLQWKRDDVDMYAFHVDVPVGVSSLEADFEILTGLRPDGVVNGLEAPRTATDALLVLEWNQVVLYPADSNTDGLRYQARVRLPAGWQAATALSRTGDSGETVVFEPTSLTTLVDSTLIAGRYFQSFELGGSPAVRLNVAADSATALNLTPEVIGHYKSLVREAAALFGATHYRHYDFLYVLTDQIMPDGLEHHESSDNRSPYRTFLDEDIRRAEAALLAHEYTHSWNGKFRRPEGLATPNYQEPMRAGLLWVYEGLTEYLGNVLATRSGLFTPEEFRGELAHDLAGMQTHAGRASRNLQDTTVAAQLLYVQPRDWAARLRRQDDFYQESALLWLEADTLIRRLSKGRRSLDDFCRHFYGPPSTAPEVRAYDLAALVAALNDIQPYDWEGFWRQRLDRHSDAQLNQGVLQSGWKLVFGAGPATMHRAHEADDRDMDARFSLGFYVNEDATLADIIPESPADHAGLSPGDKVIAVNDRKWSQQELRDVLAATTRGSSSVTLLVERGDTIQRVSMSYNGGPREPDLVRVEGTPDLLTAIGQPVIPVEGVRRQ